MQDREKAADTDFQVITMDEEMEASLKEAAVISMGTEISSEDMSNIVELCDQVRCSHTSSASIASGLHLPTAELLDVPGIQMLLCMLRRHAPLCVRRVRESTPALCRTLQPGSLPQVAAVL